MPIVNITVRGEGNSATFVKSKTEIQKLTPADIEWSGTWEAFRNDLNNFQPRGLAERY